MQLNWVVLWFIVHTQHTCVQALASQVGTNEAMVRFSMAVVPGGMKPPGLNTLQAKKQSQHQ
jgi:hypothetical protein